MTKYHIRPKDMSLQPCHASVRPCPYGGLSEHFTSQALGQEAMDSLNEQSVQKTGFEMWTKDGKIAMTERTKRALSATAIADLQIKKMNNRKAVLRQALLQQMKEQGIDSYKDSELGSFKAKDAYTQRRIDEEKLRKETGDTYFKDVAYTDYSYLKLQSKKARIRMDYKDYTSSFDGETKEYVFKSNGNGPDFRINADKLEDTDFSKKKNFDKAANIYKEELGQAKAKEKLESITSPGRLKVAFKFDVDENGVARPDAKTKEMLKTLKDYEAKTKELEENLKDVKNELARSMKENNVGKIEHNGYVWNYQKETVRQRPDTKVLREFNLYDDYAKEIQQPESLQIRWTKKIA